MAGNGCHCCYLLDSLRYFRFRQDEPFVVVWDQAWSAPTLVWREHETAPSLDGLRQASSVLRSVAAALQVGRYTFSFWKHGHPYVRLEIPGFLDTARWLHKQVKRVGEDESSDEVVMIGDTRWKIATLASR